MRNFLKSGDYVTPIPAGITVDIRYNDMGIIDKAVISNKEKEIEVAGLLDTIKKLESVPNTIKLKGGSTHIFGVLHSSNCIYSESGSLNDIQNTVGLGKFLETPHNFNFYAIEVYGTRSGFNNMVAVRNWLLTSGFKMLQGFIAPANISFGSVENFVISNPNIFSTPLVQSVYYSRGGSPYLDSTNIYQYLVDKVNLYADQNGYIKAKLIDSQGNTHYCDYYDVYQNDIQSSTLIFYYEDDPNNIIYTKNLSTKRRLPVSSNLYCETCGCKITASIDGTKCPNHSCLSNQYNAVVSMLSTLNLPIIDFEQYKELVHNGAITNIIDILELDQYSEYKFDYDIKTLIRAIIPMLVVSSNQTIQEFVSKCNSNIKNIMFMIDHPNKIYTDLSMRGLQVDKLVEWLSEDYNILLFKALFNLDKVHIVDTDKRFKGAPMFYGKTFVLTGEFKAGTKNDVKAILQSYEGKVNDYLDDAVSCVLTGATAENINGTIIRRAKEKNIPIFEEEEFFTQYGIYDDLKEQV